MSLYSIQHVAENYVHSLNFQTNLNREEYVYDTSDLAAGVYFLVLDEGDIKLNKKFVKP